MVLGEITIILAFDIAPHHVSKCFTKCNIKYIDYILWAKRIAEILSRKDFPNKSRLSNQLNHCVDCEFRLLKTTINNPPSGEAVDNLPDNQGLEFNTVTVNIEQPAISIIFPILFPVLMAPKCKGIINRFRSKESDEVNQPTFENMLIPHQSCTSQEFHKTFKSSLSVPNLYFLHTTRKKNTLE